MVSRADLARHPHWRAAFAGERKDHRYYEIVEDTVRQGFDYRYFVIKDDSGTVRAIQPCFFLDQDLLQGLGRQAAALVERVRRLWPRFMRMRTLMVGCVAGEGHLDHAGDSSRGSHARLLAADVARHARDLKAHLIVLKEFPA
ncbi:MAG TPA: GNAT family N-acetyltransferase, partial [Xanthobacteraceae bacterium]|nr:GNAT family N-acetyltransferase [Xanthobacteraceae bacterium]